MAKKLLSYLIILFLIHTVAGQDGTKISDPVCSIIKEVYFALNTIAYGLVALMFVYGGIKYIFSSDDPGGRKQGKSICIQAVIGGIIVLIAGAIVSVIGLTASCIT